MTLGDKLAKLRKENNYTQEQLANILGVSRQAVSKWESDTTYPETDKLLKLGELYQCSMDYLLKEGDKARTESKQESIPCSHTITLHFNMLNFERKSAKHIHGLPLWHINIGYGRTAKGIIAVGLRAKGFVSIGLFSLGFFSFGLLSLGIFALGVMAAGILSAAAISAGLIAFGAISIGILSVGALSMGSFSVGAMAIGKYFALGDHAQAMIAIGKTQSIGNVCQKLGELTSEDISTVKTLLDTNVPFYLSWARELTKLFL